MAKNKDSFTGQFLAGVNSDVRPSARQPHTPDQSSPNSYSAATERRAPVNLKLPWCCGTWTEPFWIRPVPLPKALPMPCGRAVFHAREPGRFVGPPIGESLRHFTEVPEDQVPRSCRSTVPDTSPKVCSAPACIRGSNVNSGRLQGLGVHRARVAHLKPERIAIQVIERFGLADYFETVSGAADDLAQPKRSHLHARQARNHRRSLARLDITTPDPQRTVMIGDRSYDAEGAHAHGLECIGAGWGFGQPGNSTNCAWRWSVLRRTWQQWFDRYNNSGEGQSGPWINIGCCRPRSPRPSRLCVDPWSRVRKVPDHGPVIIASNHLSFLDSRDPVNHDAPAREIHCQGRIPEDPGPQRTDR